MELLCLLVMNNSCQHGDKSATCCKRLQLVSNVAGKLWGKFASHTAQYINNIKGFKIRVLTVEKSQRVKLVITIRQSATRNILIFFIMASLYLRFVISDSCKVRTIVEDYLAVFIVVQCTIKIRLKSIIRIFSSLTGFKITAHAFFVLVEDSAL